jgi:predicted MFS family arabinose efflux permease
MTAVAVTPPVVRPFPRVALLALAAGAFVMCTAEFVIAGLLPEVAADLGVGISTAGLLISGYAAAIVVGGPTWSRRSCGPARSPSCSRVAPPRTWQGPRSAP